MRVGQNPAKFVNSVPEPAKVTVAILVYIPFLSGYYAQSAEVLEACLNSIWDNTTLPYDLLVFDNASCAEVRHYLDRVHEQGKIQYLVKSDKNIGKAAAWNFIFSAAPGEFIAYGDSDIYFESGWLSALVNLLKTFPNAGMVTGIPMWSPEEFSTSTVSWAKRNEDVRLERGKLLSWEDYWRHARSLGQTESEARENFKRQQEYAFTKDGIRYFIGAGHFQFAARKQVLQEVIPIPADRPMGQVRRLDAAINARGYLRLSTAKWWVHHMGNTLPENLKPKLKRPSPTPRKQNRLRGPLRRAVQWVYHKSFELLYK